MRGSFIQSRFAIHSKFSTRNKTGLPLTTSSRLMVDSACFIAAWVASWIILAWSNTIGGVFGAVAIW